MQLGNILPRLPRDKMIVQTKVSPKPKAKEFLKTFDTSMDYLKLDYVDLLALAWYQQSRTARFFAQKGRMRRSCAQIAKGRALPIRWLFDPRDDRHHFGRRSTAASVDYINVHWYFVNDLNWAAIAAARKRDMGVFIISPNDKGGKLYEPPKKLVELCAPLSPMQFNDLYCLARAEVHTLSCGASRPTDF